jgi:hypothetical protein
MHETRNPDEVAELIRTSYTPALSGTIAIDGRDGVGKTSLAIVLQNRIGGTLVSLDDFLMENRGGYVPNLKTGKLKAILATAIRPIVIEGVCMLSALERVGHENNLLIYVKRLVGGYYWVDEEMCDPEEPVDELISRRAQEARSFAQLDAELSGELLPEHDEPGLTPLREEIIRYHARYRPSRHAEIIFLTKA